MKLILNGDYNKKLIDEISKKGLPVTHYIMYVPQNSIGSSSIFLPRSLPNWDEFNDFVQHVKQTEITPIAQIDSTCQGNFEAHVEQFHATISLMERLKHLGIKEVVVSSPNNVGFIKAKFPTFKIYLSYSQLVVSMNRAKIFFEVGADNIILHPDVARNMNTLKNFLKLPSKLGRSQESEFILPLNLGCNWGCIQWYYHHNLQSHRTISSPVFENQSEISNVKDEFDYPLLYCWKKRVEDPKRILKACWISPLDLVYYEEMGYENFLLFTNGMNTPQSISLIESYTKKTLDLDFNEFLQIPHPYGDYWPKDLANNSLIQLTPEIISEFSGKLPRNGTHTEEDLNRYYEEFSDKTPAGDLKARETLLSLIEKKLEELRKGAIGGNK